MKHYDYRTIAFIVFLVLSGCKRQSQHLSNVQAVTTIHYNMVIVPDLSNRLKRSANLPDADIIRSLASDIYPKIVNHHRVMNQHDRFRVVLTSRQLGTLHQVDFSKLDIRLDQFKNQHDRIDYLKSRCTGRTLGSDTAFFTAEFRKIETEARKKTDGADIWSFLNTGLCGNLTAVAGKPQLYGRQYLQDKYRNILVLLTDGYIEAGISGPKGCEGRQCHYLSGELIRKFREAYQKRADKRESLSGFYQRNGYGIVAVTNPYLKEFEVLVLGVDDRTLTATGNATIVPSDDQIIRLFWEDWMRRSGVQHFELYPLSISAADGKKTILSFMGIL